MIIAKNILVKNIIFKEALTIDKVLKKYIKLQIKHRKWIFPPVDVVKINKKYHVIDGNHRAFVANILKFKYIPVFVINS